MLVGLFLIIRGIDAKFIPEMKKTIHRKILVGTFGRVRLYQSITPNKNFMYTTNKQGNGFPILFSESIHGSRFMYMMEQKWSESRNKRIQQ